MSSTQDSSAIIEYAIRLKKSVIVYSRRIYDERIRVLAVNATVGLLTVGYLFLIHQPTYESKISLMPDFGSKSPSAGVSALISMAGVGEFSAPTEIYQNLVTSEAVLKPVLLQSYTNSSSGVTGTLLEHLEVERNQSFPNQELRDRATLISGLGILREQVEPSIDRATKILTITVTMPDAQLAADVANSLAASLDDYVRSKRKSYATNQVMYLGRRLDEVRDSLAVAEELLRLFRETNRVVGQSPSLLMQQTRMTRNLEILQIVYGELYKQLELARIEEIRDTPVINIREEAQNPIYQAGPRKLIILIVVMYFAFCLSIAWVLLRPWVYAIARSH